MLNALLTIVVAALLPGYASFSTGAQRTHARPKPVTSNTILEGWVASDNVLTSLVRVGFSNRVPLGIIIEGDSLCAYKAIGNNADTTVGNLIGQLGTQVPGYMGEVRNGTLFIHPTAMKENTLHALDLVIPHFTTGPTNAQAMGVSLWMYIRAVLVPQEGSAFVGGTQRDAETLPSLEASRLTVHDILDRVITQGQGGLWIVHEVPADWQSHPKANPFDILSYSGDYEASKSIKCSQ